MKPSRKRTQFLIFAIDVLLLFLSLVLALVLRRGGWPSQATLKEHLGVFSLVFLGWELLFYTAGLYNLDLAFDSESFIRRLVSCIVIATLATALLFYLDRSQSIAPKTVLALVALFALGLISGWRFVIGRYRRYYLPKIMTAFVGGDDILPEIVQALREKPQLGYETACIFLYNGRDLDLPRDLVHRDSGSFHEALFERDVDLVVISDERSLTEEFRASLFELIKRPVRFMRLPDFYETITRRVPIGTINDLWFLENIDLRSKRPYEIAKRGIDLFLASLLLLITMPFWPFIAVAIKLGSPGPVFFIQKRLGRGGKVFSIIKFRTMRQEENDFSPTAAKDARVTRLGAALRSTRVDELPQMINIFRGEMSFVGPRPERPELAEELEKAIPYYRQRLLVKPGVTGWDQVSGEYHSPSIEDTYKKLQADLYYVKNFSAFLDFSIFFKTIMTVLNRAGR